MRSVRTSIIAFALLVMAGVFTSTTLQADQWNKKTIVTIKEPLQIPGTVLQPGTYVFKLEDSQADRHIVRVMNEDETEVIATVLAYPNYHLQQKGTTDFQFWEVPTGNPAALRAWFYPGDNFGQEFAYPPAQAAQLAAVTKEEVPAAPPAAESTAPIPAPTPAPAPTAEATPPPAPEPAPQAAPAPAPEPAPAQEAAAPVERLPKTASNLPLFALFGLMSLGIALLLRVVRDSNS